MKKFIIFMLLCIILTGTSYCSEAYAGNQAQLTEAAIHSYSIPQQDNTWYGVIGTSKIHAVLSINDNEVTGAYYYDKSKKNIKLTGSITKEYRYYSSISLYEDTRESAYFNGIFKTADYIEGYWKCEDKIYPMYLIREGINTAPPVSPDKVSLLFDGHWNDLSAYYYGGSEAEIKVLFDDLLYFELNAYNGANMGSLEGLAVIKNGTAITTFSEKVEWDNDKSANVKFSFKIKKKNLLLSSNKYDFDCGFGVSFASTYTKETIEVKIPTAIEVGIADSEDQSALFEKLVGDKYEEFVQYTQSVNYEELEMDGKKVSAGASYLRGCAGYCYYIKTDKYLYAAIKGDGCIDFYTNDPAYKDRLPQPMKEWASNYSFEADSDIIYHYQK